MDRASRIPAPPLDPDPPRETNVDLAGCPVSAQNPLSAQIKQGVKEKSSAERARGSGNTNRTERKMRSWLPVPDLLIPGEMHQKIPLSKGCSS